MPSRELRARLARAEQLAGQKGLTVAQLATAWILSQPLPVFALVGGANRTELASTCAGAAVTLTPDECRWLEAGEVVDAIDEAYFQFLLNATNISHISSGQNFLHYRIPNLIKAGSITDLFLKNISQDQTVAMSAGVITSTIAKAGLSYSFPTPVPP